MPCRYHERMGLEGKILDMNQWWFKGREILYYQLRLRFRYNFQPPRYAVGLEESLLYTYLDVSTQCVTNQGPYFACRVVNCED